MNVGRKIGKGLCNIILLMFSISCVFPILWLFSSSLKTEAEFNQSSMALPKSFNPGNFKSIIQETNLPLYVLNSFRNTIISVAIIILISFMAGYVLSRYHFKGRSAIYNYFIIGMLVPIHALLVPMYVQFKQAGLINHWYTLILPYVSFGLPLSIMLIESYIETIPRELQEAAAIDVCRFYQTMIRIILPMARPILSTVAIIQFFACWNEFSFALILVSKDELRTVPVGLTMFQGAYTVNYPRMMAGILVTIIPVMVLYFIFSKRIIEGMVAGAVKG